MIFMLQKMFIHGAVSIRILSLLLLVSLTSHGQAASFMPSMPENLDEVDIYLHTVDIKDQVYNNFGHTAIRVRDRQSGQDMVYNWGIFDFGEPVSFALKFYRGILIYKLGIYPYRVAKRQYQYEQRTVWQDQLNFTAEQKRIFLQRLIWHAKPENRDYQYQYFFDNCSTRPRDYIDEALAGKVADQFKGQLTERSFRDYVFAGYQYNPEILLSLDLLMNSDIDRPVTAWEAMFHPLDLRTYLQRVETEQGPLLIHSQVLYQFEGLQPPAIDGHSLFALVGGLGIVLIITFLLMAQKSAAARRWTSMAYRLLGAWSLVFFLYGGLLGILMPLTWAVSEHSDLHHNLNMLLFLPFDLVFFFLAWGWLLRGRASSLRPQSLRLLRRYLQLHIILIAALVMSWALDYLAQDVEYVVLFVTPVYLGLYSLILSMVTKPSMQETREGS